MKNWKRITCIILVISICICAFAIPVSASVTAAVLIPVSAGLVIGAVLIGIGIIPAPDSTAFDELVDDVNSFLTGIGSVVDGTIDVLSIGSSAYVTHEFINRIREYLFGGGVLATNMYWGDCIYNPHGKTITSGISAASITPSVDTYYIKYFTVEEFTSNTKVTPYIGIVSADARTNSLLYLNGNEVTFSGQSRTFSSSSYTAINGVDHLTYVLNAQYFNKSDSTEIQAFINTLVGAGYQRYDGPGGSSSNIVMAYYTNGQVVTPETVITMPGLNSGTIAGEDEDIPVGYPLWDSTTITNPETQEKEESSVVALAPTYEETKDLTQEDVWAGTGTYNPGETVPEDATLGDVISSIIAIPGRIFGAIGDALASFFGFSGVASDYAIELKDFFPFCIPFDLYEFFTLLVAEPEAPVIHWEIPVPQLGQTFTVDVDLSPWDNVASLFRNLELLAFIVGLAMITREKFLRG